jgi:hypothetical protein
MIFEKVKYLNSTNHKFDYMIGEVGSLKLKEGYSAEFANLKVWLVTSIIESVDIEGDIITLKTLNSTYTFMNYLGE